MMNKPNSVDRIKLEEEELAKMLKLREEQENPTELTPEEVAAKAVLEDPKNHSDDEVDWAKRYGDTRRLMSEKDAKAKETIEAQAAEILALQSNSPENIPTDAEGLADWKKKNPVLFAAMTKIATDMATDMQADLKGEVTTLKDKEHKSNGDLVEAKVLKKFPEFAEYRKDKAFHDWIKDQDEWIDVALYGGQDYKKAIQAITLYKAENGLMGGAEKKKEAPKKDTSAADLINKGSNNPPADGGTPKGTLLESEIALWTEKDWGKRGDEYAEARAAGKIDYDLAR